MKEIKNPKQITLENMTADAEEYMLKLQSEFQDQLDKYPFMNNQWTML
jgi:hypothetical protein